MLSITFKIIITCRIVTYWFAYNSYIIYDSAQLFIDFLGHKFHWDLSINHYHACMTIYVNREEPECVLPDSSITPNSKQNGQPNGDGMEDDRVVSMDQGEDGPSIRVHVFQWHLSTHKVMDHKWNV